MHEVLVNRLGGLSLPRKSVVRSTDRPDMTLDVYRGRKTTKQQQSNNNLCFIYIPCQNSAKISSGSGEEVDIVIFAIFSNSGHLRYST